jgi:hypothetical protein
VVSIQGDRNGGGDSAVNGKVGFLACANRFIEQDIARIIGPAIWDGITFRIKRANHIESVINRLAIV